MPALSWSTTVWPIIQCGLMPVIVDIDPATFNIDPNEIEKAIGPKTRAVMIVPVYGNPCAMDAIVEICKRRNLILIEDCCEALGAYYDGKAVGKFGRVGTFSFYFSHHLTTLEGGITVTDDFELAELMRILRAHGWVREVKDRDRWLKKYPEFDPRFLFVNVGYNLRPMELSAARWGWCSCPSSRQFVDTRRENSAWFRRELAQYGDFFDFQEEQPKGRHSWFGFPIRVKANAGFKVTELTKALNAKHVETRPIIAGNIARQPALKLYDHRVVGDMKHSNAVMDGAFSFGNHQDVDFGRAPVRRRAGSRLPAVAVADLSSMIITRTPLRVSFFGGGTDYPAWFREHGGAVLATTIDKYLYLHCRYLPPFFDFRSRIVWSKIEQVQEPARSPIRRSAACWNG